MTKRIALFVLLTLLAPLSARAVCGDGTLDAGEYCDDANTVGGDGGPADCLFEGCSLAGTWVGDPIPSAGFCYNVIEG